MNMPTKLLSALAVATAFGLTALPASATDQNWGNFGGSTGFSFGGNFGVANEGKTTGQYGKVTSESWKHLEGNGEAVMPGSARGYVFVGGGTTGTAKARSRGHGPQNAGTMETGSIFGEGFVETFRQRGTGD